MSIVSGGVTTGIDRVDVSIVSGGVTTGIDRQSGCVHCQWRGDYSLDRERFHVYYKMANPVLCPLISCNDRWQYSVLGSDGHMNRSQGTHMTPTHGTCRAD